MDVLAALSRWLHMISAIVAIGGAFFLWWVVPVGLAEADAASRDSVLRSMRRKFKRAVHIAVTLLILTGIFNTYRAWWDYKIERGLMHALWGMHVLVGVIVIGLSISLLAKPEPPANHRKLLTVNVVLMLILVGLASTLKVVRDRAVKKVNWTNPVQVDR